MTAEATVVALAAILDLPTLVQAQLDALTNAGQRIQATHKVILQKVDTINAGQAAVADLTPRSDTMLEVRHAAYSLMGAACDRRRRL